MNQRRITLTILMTLPLMAVASADWPEFRGPAGDGHAGENSVGLPLEWSEANNVMWKTEIPHKGWSTPVVMNGQVWLTTATLDGHDFFAICVDEATGKILFNEKIFHCDSPESLGNSVNCYAAPSPAIEPGRVYVHFGTFGTACIDTKTFKTLWERTDIHCRHYRGPASSVILFENTIILTMDGADVQYLIALDKQTGKTAWKTDRSVKFDDSEGFQKFAKEGDLRKAHSTPLIIMIDGQPQMFTPGAKAAYAYDPRTGQELWRIQFIAWSAAPRPVCYKNLALIDTGLGGTELWAVRLGGTGDVTGSHVAWKLKDRIVPKTASPIIVDDLVYMVNDDGSVGCVDPTTGAIVWKNKLSGNYAASPVYADGRLYFCSQQGKTTVLKPGRTFEVLAINELDNGFMASPAVDGNALFLRTKTHLYRVENAKP